MVRTAVRHARSDAGPRGDVPAPLGASLREIPRVRTLGDEAYARLREALMAGRLRPGQRITVRGLGEALGISLTPAREAIGRLVTEGALADGPNRTVQVPVLTRDDYEESLAIRLALEPMAAARAVSRLAGADVDALRALQDDARAAHGRGDVGRVLQCNERFHLALVRGSGLPAVIAIVEGQWVRVGPTLNLLHERAYASGPWRGDANHRAILAALGRRDPERVAAAVRKDLLDGSDRLRRVLPQAPGADRPGGLPAPGVATAAPGRARTVRAP